MEYCYVGWSISILDQPMRTLQEIYSPASEAAKYSAICLIVVVLE